VEPRRELRVRELSDESQRVVSPGKSNRGMPVVTRKRLFAVDPLRDERWRELIERHPASSVFHSTEWLHALRSAYGYEAVAYTDCEPSVAIASAIVFCRVTSWLTGRRLVSLPFSDHCEPLVGSSEELDDLLLLVRENLAPGHWKYGEIRPLGFEPGVSTGFGQCERYFLHAVDLRPGIDEIFRRLHHSVQRKIRRAEREALVYEEGNSEQLLEHFYKLVVATRRRQHLPPQPKQWFRSLIASLGANLKIRVAFKDGMPIASILTLSHKKTVTYKYGSSDERMHPLGGVALVFWNTIQQAKAAGCETLDLGRSDIDNHGLAAFKEHWGGIRSDLRYWRYPNRPPSHHHSSMKQSIIGRIVRMAPDRVLIAAGSLLYRHIG